MALEQMSNSFFNMLGESKLFPKLNALPNIPAPTCILRFLCRLGPIVSALFIATFAGKLFLLIFRNLLKMSVR